MFVDFFAEGVSFVILEMWASSEDIKPKGESELYSLIN